MELKTSDSSAEPERERDTGKRDKITLISKIIQDVIDFPIGEFRSK